MEDNRGTSRDNESLDAAIGVLAATQFGVFSRAQAVELRASARQIQHRLARGRWDSPMPKVYRIAGATASRRQRVMAAALWARSGAVISHSSAGALWGIEGIRERKVELWVPAPRNPRAPDVQVHRGTRIDRADRTEIGPIPVTTPVRTVIDLAGRLEDHRLLAAMESVFRRNLGTPERLASRLVALRESGRPGAGRLEQLLAGRGDGRPLESTLESKIWLLLSASDLPRPARQHWVTTSGGRYRFDFAWPDHKLGLECDGWEHHGDREAFGKDRVRLSEMASSGWRVLLVTWDLGTRDPGRVLRWVERSLALAA